MQQVDVAVIGAGAAGAMCAAMLGRKGYDVAVVDPIHPFGADFRCEKLEHAHIDALSKAGLLDEVLPHGRPYDRIWIARLGHLVEKRPMVEYGIEYADLVNTLRSLIPTSVSFVCDKVIGLEAGATRQRLVLASGDSIEARLVIGASGLGNDVLSAMGMSREVVSKCHSVSIGFDLAPVGRDGFDFDALTYFGEAPEHRVAYFTIFPIGDHVRANLFVYRELSDPWFKTFRADPVGAMHAAMPRLQHLTGEFRIIGTPRVRPVDLVNTQGREKPGIVLIGDAFATACPVSGTGASKAMVDAERLCNIYVPQWLAQPAITAADIAAFYTDPEKRASDTHSRGVSLFAKRLTLEPGPGWTIYRWARCVASMGRNAVSHARHVVSPEKAGLQWQ
jgi:2-polyprenyl-6-methoxyphenol hydroxylase-like FAD-dependent oxidoreductase